MFHRLTAPSYIGGLPVGYDYVNNLLAGTPSPVDPVVANPSTYAGTYFVAFGEDGRAAAVNRGLKALSENTDFIDDFLRSDTAVATYLDFPVGPAVIPGSATQPTYRGLGLGNSSAELEPYFHVTDQQNNDIVEYASNTQSKVISITNYGAGFTTGAITCTVSPAPTVPYRIWYGRRSSLAEMSKGEFVRPNVWGANRGPAALYQHQNNLKKPTAGPTYGGSLVGISDALFNPATVPGGGLGGLSIDTVQKAITAIDTRFFGGAAKVDTSVAAFAPSTAAKVLGGGIGSAAVTAQSALNMVDDQLVRRRAWTAVLTDGTASQGGDFNGPTALESAIAFYASEAHYFVRDGTYPFTNTTPGTIGTPIKCTPEHGFFLTLAAGRTSDLKFTADLELAHAGLISQSATYKSFNLEPAGTTVTLRRCPLMGGALFVGAGALNGRINFIDVDVVGSLGGTSTVASLDIAGESKILISNCTITGTNGTTPRSLYLHDIVDNTKSRVLVENSVFEASTVGADIVRIANVLVPTTFRNCTFRTTAASGNGYPLHVSDSRYIEFDNCTFESDNGLVVRVTDSNVHFTRCLWRSSNTNPGAATIPMIVIEPGGEEPSSIHDCKCVIGSSSLRGSGGTVARAVVELGGFYGTASNAASIHVDGLFVEYLTGVTLAHNYTTILMHGSASTRRANVYDNVTFDTKGVNSDNAGTLGGRYANAASPWVDPGVGVSITPYYVEVGGGSLNKDCCTVKNLQVKNVVNPAVARTGGIIYLARCRATGVHVDGTATQPAGAFKVALVTAVHSALHDLSMCKTYNINMDQAVLWHLGLDYTSLNGGGFYGHKDPAAGITAWVVANAYCTIDDYTVWIDGVTGGGAKKPLVHLAGKASRVTNSNIVVTGAAYGTPILDTAVGSAECALLHNHLMTTDDNGVFMISLGGLNSLSLQNLCTSETGVPPTTNVNFGSSVAADYYKQTAVTAERPD